MVISWVLVWNILKGITAGVYHLHQENILHRDLASRNILLRANYEPLIADFGLSKKVPPLENPNPTVQTTESTLIRGPYKWMVTNKPLTCSLFLKKKKPYVFKANLTFFFSIAQAPESLARNEFSVKSDSYSFGVLVWEILARSNEPYPQMDIYQAAKAVQQGGSPLTFLLLTNEQ